VWERRRQNRTVTIVGTSAMSGPKTKAPVMAASIDVSCVCGQGFTQQHSAE